MKKRFVCMLLAMCIMFSLFSVTAMAAVDMGDIDNMFDELNNLCVNAGIFLT